MAELKFRKASADIFIPSGAGLEDSLARTTHLCIAAHQDDVEILACHGVLECFGHKDRGFAAVIATEGSGSARSGIYSDCSDDEMKSVRVKEQRKAAFIGEYSALIQLGYKSSEVKQGRRDTRGHRQDIGDVPSGDCISAQPCGQA